MRIFLGIDPGLAKTGYGVIKQDKERYRPIDYGVFSTKAGNTPGERLNKIYIGICDIIDAYKPDEAGIEKLYFAKNITSALPVAQARGVVLLALAQKNVPAFEYAPQEIKQAIVGAGRADKSQVQELVRLILGMQEIPKPDHAADALAAAICHGNSMSGLSARKKGYDK